MPDTPTEQCTACGHRVHLGAMCRVPVGQPDGQFEVGRCWCAGPGASAETDLDRAVLDAAEAWFYAWASRNAAAIDRAERDLVDAVVERDTARRVGGSGAH